MHYYVYNDTTGIILNTGFVMEPVVNPVSGETEAQYQARVASARATLLSSRAKNSGTTAVEGIADGKTQKVNVSDGSLVAYTPPDVRPVGVVNRSSRESLLKASDWTHFTDSPLTASKKAEWATYRQALRDLPTTVATFETQLLVPSDFPTKPS